MCSSDLAAGRVVWGRPPLMPEGADAPVGIVANPLPQALILTAIVIGFGVVAFAIVLVLFGGGKIAGVGKALGTAIAEFKSAVNSEKKESDEKPPIEDKQS